MNDAIQNSVIREAVCAGHTQTADLQVNQENFVVECFNRVPIPKV